MRMTKALAALPIAAVLVATAAAVPASAAAPTVPTYHLRDSGKTVSLMKGDRVRVDLKTEQDGGYAWVRRAPTGTGELTLIKKSTRPYDHPPMTVGYPYHTTYLFEATKNGPTTLRFVERRSFDKTDVIKRFRLTVNVHS